MIEFSQLHEGGGDMGAASYGAPGGAPGSNTGVSSATLHSPQPSPAKPGKFSDVVSASYGAPGEHLGVTPECPMPR